MAPQYPLISLVSRLMIAQSVATAAIGLCYYRRNVPWLVLAIVAALVICALAAAIRAGGHSIWLVAIGVESGLVAAGLFQFAYDFYLGGTLLAIMAVGTLLHPSVARAFALGPAGGRPSEVRPGRPEAAAEALPG